ncbi:MAG: phosphatase PAP2 family protein [Acidiferrobacterales bacterium]
MGTRFSNAAPASGVDGWRHVPLIATTHFWFKCFGTTGFTFVFFIAYVYLLKHPAYPVTIVPATALDRLIGVEPLALPFYLSLWIYVSLPPMLMTTRQAIIDYGKWIGGLCLVGLTIFYFWPTAIPPAHINWARYPGMVFLKGFDASGNACPSLHVATAVFSWSWLNRRLRELCLGRSARIFSACWCAAIVYSTMATKQHMALDVAAGIDLALVFIWAFDMAGQPISGIAGRQYRPDYSVFEQES